jgi:hypothetical protein
VAAFVGMMSGVFAAVVPSVGIHGTQPASSMSMKSWVFTI